MFALKENKPKYTHIINGHDVENWVDLIHQVAMEHYSLMADEQDGDYKFMVEFSPFYQDTTSADELKLFGDGDKEEAEYPVDWNATGKNPYGFKFYEYVEWMLLLRHIQANTPPGMHFDNILAIDRCH